MTFLTETPEEEMSTKSTMLLLLCFFCILIGGLIGFSLAGVFAGAALVVR